MNFLLLGKKICSFLKHIDKPNVVDTVHTNWF